MKSSPGSGEVAKMSCLLVEHEDLSLDTQNLHRSQASAGAISYNPSNGRQRQAGLRDLLASQASQDSKHQVQWDTVLSNEVNVSLQLCMSLYRPTHPHTTLSAGQRAGSMKSMAERMPSTLEALRSTQHHRGTLSHFIRLFASVSNDIKAFSHYENSIIYVFTIKFMVHFFLISDTLK